MVPRHGAFRPSAEHQVISQETHNRVWFNGGIQLNLTV